MSPSELKTRIEELAPGTRVQITDLTGTEDHYQAVIESPVFQGKGTLEQHRLVMDHLRKELESGEVHALTLKTQPT